MFVKVKNYIQRITQISSNIIEHIPSSKDNLPTKIVKTISLIDVVQGFFYGKRDPIEEYLSQYDLQKKNNKVFVFLFFSSRVICNFNITRIAIGNDIVVLRVKIAGNGTLFFIEHGYDSYTEMKGDFYHSPEFNFKLLMNNIWDLYGGRIYVTLRDNYEPSFSMFPISKDPITEALKIC